MVQNLYFNELPKTATAEYTGGGVYLFYGVTDNGHSFVFSNEYRNVSVFDMETSDFDLLTDSSFYELHTIYDENNIIFQIETLELILKQMPEGNYCNLEIEKLLASLHKEVNDFMNTENNDVNEKYVARLANRLLDVTKSLADWDAILNPDDYTIEKTKTALNENPLSVIEFLLDNIECMTE